MCSEYLTKAILSVVMARDDIAEAYKYASPLEALILSPALTMATELHGKLLQLEEAIDATEK